MIKFTANIVNVFDGTVSFGTLSIENGRIHQIFILGIEKEGEKYNLKIGIKGCLRQALDVIFV